MPPSDIEPVLRKFEQFARKKLNLLDVTVYTAVPLSEPQQKELEQKLIGQFGNHISMVIKIDESLLGGLRIVAGHSVIDNTIKKRLADMKKNVYRGVYFKQC